MLKHMPNSARRMFYNRESTVSKALQILKQAGSSTTVSNITKVGMLNDEGYKSTDNR